MGIELEPEPSQTTRATLERQERLMGHWSDGGV